MSDMSWHGDCVGIQRNALRSKLHNGYGSVPPTIKQSEADVLDHQMSSILHIGCLQIDDLAWGRTIGDSL
jgi:hypothetical protein